jgi:hypothetical protein
MRSPGADEVAIMVDVASPVVDIVDEVVRLLGLAGGCSGAARP